METWKDFAKRGHRAEWMSDEQWECKILLARLFGGFHRVSTVKPFGAGVSCNARLSEELATIDGNMLSRFVFLCHQHCIRGEVAQGGPCAVKLILHKRKSRLGSITERHPDLQTAVDAFELKHPWEGI